MKGVGVGRTDALENARWLARTAWGSLESIFETRNKLKRDKQVMGGNGTNRRSENSSYPIHRDNLHVVRKSMIHNT